MARGNTAVMEFSSGLVLSWAVTEFTGNVLLKLQPADAE